MELWIRAQDRKRLVKINNVEIQHHYSYKDVHEKYLLPSGNFEYRNVQKKDKYIKSVIMCNDEITLGTYKTKERALEVLDEIQNLLKPQMVLSKVGKPIAETCDGLVYITPNEYDIKEISTYVYEMPKD